MNKRNLAITTGMANSFEWYDYALFGHFAPLIGQKFFPDTDPKNSILQVFLVFAVGYLMRPIGGVFFGIIGDKWGRKTALSLSVMCMSVPTAAIGFLPSYETLGLSSTIMMILCRLLQGLSMGGALTGSISYIIEHSEEKKRGAYGSIPIACICVGILLGSLVSYLIKTIFTPEQINLWAWRIPFIIGILVFFVGAYIKYYTEETPLFKKLQSTNKIVASPIKLTFQKYWPNLIISICINATGSILFYLVAIYSTSYLNNSTNISEQNISMLNNTCYIVMIFISLFAGWLSDKIGRRRIFFWNLAFIILFIPSLLSWYESSNFILIAFSQITISIMAALYIGPEPALQAELYPTQIRNTALSISYNTATSVFGGTTPYIIESLVQNSGTITSSSYYIIFSAVIGLIALCFYKNNYSKKI